MFGLFKFKLARQNNTIANTNKIKPKTAIGAAIIIGVFVAIIPIPNAIAVSNIMIPTIISAAANPLPIVFFFTPWRKRSVVKSTYSFA